MIPRQISRIAILTIIGLLGLVLSGCGNPQSNESATPPAAPSTPGKPASSGDYKVSFRVDPDPPAGAKENTVLVTLQDGSGKPVSDAQVHVQFTMPAMPEMKMPEMSNGTDLSWNGTDYSGPIQVTMADGMLTLKQSLAAKFSRSIKRN
jgi:hypothetical protein